MTIEQILEDIKSPRVKKVILDADMYNEMDDQYALAYCIGCEKIDLLSVNAAPFYNGRSVDWETGMVDSYNEILRMYEVCGIDPNKVPAYEGARAKYSEENGFAPMDTPAARNIIKTVKESDEIIYVLTTGCCTNVTSACLIDPSIKDNMCVIWLGGHEISHTNCWEFNLAQDYFAGQLLINSGVPMVLLPAGNAEGSLGGTIQLAISIDDLKQIKGDGKVQRFFAVDLPAEFISTPEKPNVAGWVNGMRCLWDVAAPATLSVPEAFDFWIIPAPIFGDDHKYAFDKTRHKIIYMNKLDPKMVLDDTYRSIERI